MTEPCHLSRRSLCLGLFGLVAGVNPAAAGPYLAYAEGLAAHPPKGSRYRPDLEAELVDLLNAYRAGKGKAPVQADAAFQQAARAHAADMMLNGFMGHSSSTGMSFQGRMAAFVGDVTKYPSIGENAARETVRDGSLAQKTRALFQQWVDSGPHRRNMVNRSFAFVSTGVIERDGDIWAVQIFFATPRAKGIFQ
ncbi:CAP domain-containing protein [Aestuariivirga litoralis]|uniref:CAP domain-containing protein n=1 Tax=Aestuariivirga litoralis TaxID=2650924 RepID=UPI00137B7C34|nr:CAP domain-containing protein [Aestuariivirga litoralis]